MYTLDCELYQSFYKMIQSMSEVFGESNKSLHLYAHLLNKITSQHGGAIERNCLLAKAFFTKNELGISKSDISQFVDPCLRYSDKVYVDFDAIFKAADDDCRNQIWKHLLTIQINLGSNAESAKMQLQQLYDNPVNNDNIMSFFNQNGDMGDIFKALGGDNFAKSIQSIMESENFKSLMNDVKVKIDSGEIDITKLSSIVSSMAPI
jgi:hypothetical protein